MMKIESNSRQIPKVKEYTANRMYCDILYSYLQEQSYRDEDSNGVLKRYIDKNVVVFSTLGKKIGVTRQTASKRFNNLIDLGLIVQDGDRYELIELDNNIAWLVQYETLRILVNTMKEHTVNLYIYLLKRYIANGENEYQVLSDQLKEWIGVSKNTRSNSYIINDVLFMLKQIGLLEYEVVNITETKRAIIIKEVRNKIY